jgi:catechol 2,3-dioxygenase-like lactoylglutathione lyase family enzyme
MRWLLLIAAAAATLSAQLAAPNAAGVSIGHVHLIVNDPEAQKKIWVGMFGAQVTNTGTLELLRLPGIFVVLGKARTEPTGGSDGSTVNHFGFLVPSYADTKAKLTAANIPFTDNPAKKQVIAEFPEKIRVELTENSAQTIPIVFHHFHLSSTDPDKLRDWYVKTFDGKASKREQWVSAVFPGGELDFRKVDTAPAPTKGRSLDHIGFEILGLEAFCKKLEAEGVTFDTKYRVVPQLGGLQLAYVLDPEGTRIELTEGFMAHSH